MTSKVIEGHKRSSVFWEFKKILPKTFFYESIFIKIHMNADIMNTQIFYLIKYHLNGN